MTMPDEYNLTERTIFKASTSKNEYNFDFLFWWRQNDDIIHLNNQTNYYFFFNLLLSLLQKHSDKHKKLQLDALIWMFCFKIV